METKIDFSKNADGLIPAIVADAETSRVLMLGYMNSEALAETQRSDNVTFYSRSKGCLWTKGETSGNFLRVIEVLRDCDGDTLLIKAKPAGPICHTGSDTCFGESNKSDDFLKELEFVIRERQLNPKPDSHTSQLFAKGIEKIAQKVGEEAVELVIEAVRSDDERFREEAADLVYHLLVLLAVRGVEFNYVLEVLRFRHLQKAERR